ncbi:MAG: Ig-like domain-containing protein, partial [Clostridia bacterium]|nr:Ig-like domain-containing protein [Clostridia bacterium]
MLSHEDGYYGWDVLMGKWKVVFEKDGYFLAESEELDVPPEHTDVNISLVSSVAPTVKEFTAKADGGSVTLTFDKYMLTKDLLQTGAVNVTFGGVTPGGKLTAIDPKTTQKGNKQFVSASDIAGGDEVAKQFTYTFDDPLPTGATVNITVSDEAAAYNGMTLTEVYNGSVVVPESDPVVYADTMTFEDAFLLDKAVGDTFKIGELTFNGTQPGEVKYESSDETVLTVDENGNVTAVGAGYATVWATCDTLDAGRPVQVTRKPVVPDESDNAVVFCRKDNLVWNKGCWMWSDGATYGDGDPVEGDGKYLA